MADSPDDLEPLFDYRRVQPSNVISLDDDDWELTPPPKKSRVSIPLAGKKDADIEVVAVIDNDDWLPPPPKVNDSSPKQLYEDSTIKALRLKKQELLSFAKSAEDGIREVEEATRIMTPPIDAPVVSSAKPTCERAKIVLSIQDKEGHVQFRIYMDDKFERLFKLYSNKVKQEPENLVFSFDGDKISPASTPASLGMEDDDIIEVHAKKI